MRLCPVCESASRRLITHVAGIDQHIYSCCDCSMVYADGFAAIDYAEQSVYVAYETADKLRHAQQTGNRIARLRPQRSTSIVDVGCARGALLGALRELGYFNLRGIDASPGTSPDLSPGLLGSDPLASTELVILSHVAEHLPNLGPLARLRSSWLYVEVPDASRYSAYLHPLSQGFNSEHINHFTLDTLIRLVQRSGYYLAECGLDVLSWNCGRLYPICWVLCSRNPTHDVDQYALQSQQEAGSVAARLAEALKDDRAYILWGAGETAKQLLPLPALKARSLLAVVDTNPFHHGRHFVNGCVIQSPESLAKNDAVCAPIVVASYLARAEITEKVRGLGLTNRVVTLG